MRRADIIQVEPGVGSPAAGSGGGRSLSLYAGITSLLLAALVAVIPIVPRSGLVLDLTMTSAMIGVLALFVASRVRENRFDYFEVIFPLSVIYIVYFGWSTVYLKLVPEALDIRSLGPWLTPALGLALVGYVMLMLGYTLLFRNPKPSRIVNWVPKRMSFFVIVGVLGFLGQVFHYLQDKQIYLRREVSVAFSLGQQLAPLFFFAWFVLWYVVWSRKVTRVQIIQLFLVYMPLVLAVTFLLVGGKQRAILILGLPAVALWYARGRLPVKAMVAVFLVSVFVIFPLYNTFRLQDQTANTVVRLDDTLQAAAQWDGDVYMDNSLGAFFKRMAIVTSVAAVLRDVGKTVDFKRGETLFLVPVATVIPRIFWPDKPIIGLGREFGTTFQLVSAVDTSTRIAPSIVAEFYWNYHIPGVVVGMFLFGGIVRWVYRTVGEGGVYDPIRKGIYIMLLERMLHFESNAAMIFNIMIRSVMVLAVILIVMRAAGLVGETSEVSAESVNPSN